MIMVGGAVEVSLRQLVQRLDRRQLPAPSPSRRPLLDPTQISLDGDLVLVGARHGEDAERILLTLAIDAASDRDVLVVVADVMSAKFQAASIITGFPAASLSSLTSHQRELLDWSNQTIDELPIEIVDATTREGRASAVWSWLRRHRDGVVALPSTWPKSLAADEEDDVTFVRSMKELAREASGAVMLPWRLEEHWRDAPHPRLCDLAVTGSAEEHADVVLLFSELDDGVEIVLAKNRHGPTSCLYDSRDDSRGM